MITSHLMDLDQVLELSPGARVRAGDADDARDADVVVLLSATPLTVGTSRLEYLAKNAVIADALAPPEDGVIVVVTNPVDPLVTRLQRRTGFDRRRILGYTINDSLRLRTGLARALGVPPGSVDAWAIGEHGDLSVPLFDRVAVNGEPVRPTRDQAAAAEEYFRTWYVRHVALDSGRSSTWTSGLGIARMVAALDGDGELWPASVVLDGEYGIHGVALTVPVTIGHGGVRQIHEWELAQRDLDALRAAAELVRGAAASVA
jgi:malate/lactate dehydrogenase